MWRDIRNIAIKSSSRELLSTDIEECVLYDRSDGKHVEMTVCWVDSGEPLLSIGIYTQKALRTGNPAQSVEFSMAEARLLRDLLNRPAVASILDETKEHRMRRLPGFTLAEIEQLQKLLDEEAQS